MIGLAALESVKKSSVLHCAKKYMAYRKKYKPYILKQVPCILKNLPCIFCLYNSLINSVF